MKLRIFGKSRLPQKNVVLKVSRLLRGSESSDFSSTSCSYIDKDKHPKVVNPQAYLLAKQRMQEIETQKAIAISESRHPRWKGAGGPL